MRKPSILGGPCHPWLFLEEVSVLSTMTFKMFLQNNFVQRNAGKLLPSVAPSRERVTNKTLPNFVSNMTCLVIEHLKFGSPSRELLHLQLPPRNDFGTQFGQQECFNSFNLFECENILLAKDTSVSPLSFKLL